ncbi:hypothetical protein EOL96_08495, partial [Candidatus Saccharibacteria bacterium]|nr:hypothetical protein [Candidatus Saccharibacteria bacterium]
MAEIDFDELDKAVSSLMENVKKPNQQPTSETSDVSADTSQDDDEASHSGQVDETTEVSESTQPDTDATAPEQTATPTTPSEGEESTAPRPSLANKRRGQFMDMKHASADMRAVPTAVKPMSRIGASLAPISSITKSDDDTEQKESTESRPTFTESPRDNHSDSSQPQEDDTLLLPASYEYENDVEKASGVRDEDDDKPTSPFLSDAKVEKRPLGAPSPLINDNETVDSSNQDDQDADAPAEERPLTHGTELSVSSESIAPAASPSKLPKELHSSVLEVEADTTAIDTKSRGS